MMRTNDKMNDEERKAAWAAVADPREALEELAAHRMFIGGDPYYRDLENALWDMVDRALDGAAETGA